LRVLSGKRLECERRNYDKSEEDRRFLSCHYRVS